MSSGRPDLNVLAIDTSTESCSAAVLLRDGRLVLRSTLTERSHADLILPMVDAVLGEAGLRLRELDGLAFGRGPGGFTGLRIAAGVAQGLAYGAGLKVAPVSSLAASAFSVPVRDHGPDGVLVCNDARMQEVYWGCYRFDASAPALPVELCPERVSPAARVEPAAGVGHFAGNGIARYPELRARLEAAALRFHDGVYPRADAVARIGATLLALGLGVEPSQAVPVYVRDDVARPAGAAVTGMS